MKKRIIFVFGNEIVEQDSLPVTFLPKLTKTFPEVEFIRVDPTESWTYNETDLIIIDTVLGIDKPKIFNSLDVFEKTKLISPHDYDLYTDLKLLIKIGKINKVTIIGISESEDFKRLKELLERFIINC